MLDDIVFSLCCYLDIVENMVALSSVIDDASHMAGLLTILHTDIRRLISMIDSSSTS
jgi:hypothetical protein